MNLKSKLISLHKSGKLKFIFVILLAGIVLLVLSGSKTPSVQSSLDGETSLEAKIRTLCESVDGVSSVNVAVSLDGDGEVVGIGIVCRGGSDPKIQRELLSLVSAACGVGSNRIFITEAQK